eukprot:CAMPEP_0197547420 /NCGR_PEP_ID=MMETSP1320-20131121/1783_1 /TAXON_ID=91990 /ORGANISM="Bolidomonas sp., Strain RCC2347" /LENGTH=37 /DNA_ID= /DNA_START= /DNA_END= /DNA_ORIENTATION=
MTERLRDGVTRGKKGFVNRTSATCGPTILLRRQVPAA